MNFPIKVCGITRLEDALHAKKLGAFAIGFIFYPKSSRYLNPGAAGEISVALGPGIERVGVFVDESPDEIRRITVEAGLTAVQLHGDEPPEHRLALKGIPVIKAFRVGGDFDTGLLEVWKADYHLLDTYVSGSHGGTGETFDWAVARSCRNYGRIILAGGLHAGNVREAVRIADPWGVDVSSGVEISPGVKDLGKMDMLFHAMEINGEHL